MHKQLLTLLLVSCGITPLFGLHHPLGIATEADHKTAVATTPRSALGTPDARAAQHRTGAEVKAATETKEPRATAALKVIPSEMELHIPNELGHNEKLDTTEKESLSTDTFSESIKEYHSRGRPYFLARVVTQDTISGKFKSYYYEAHKLNYALFGGSYPLKITHSHRALYNFNPEQEASLQRAYRNPLDNLPIKNGIHYFSSNPEEPTAGFTYFCSHEQLLADDPKFLLQFYENQAEDATLHEKSLLQLGAEYYYKKDKAALAYLEPIAQNSSHKTTQITALYFIALINHYGLPGVPRNSSIAKKYFTIVEQTSTSLLEQMDASRHLGAIHFYGDAANGIIKDYRQAVHHLQKAAFQKESLLIQYDALYMLAEIYATGSNSRPRNITQAIACLLPAAEQTISPDIQKKALALKQQIEESEEEEDTEVMGGVCVIC